MLVDHGRRVNNNGCLTGDVFRSETHANNHKLTQMEESLLQWILSIDLCGSAPRPAAVEEMANLFLAKRGSEPVQLIGKNWVSNFMKRHPEISA